MTTPKTLREASCADDYDPNSMPVAKARELIRTFLSPVTAIERVHIRNALGRVLAADVVSPIAVPGHDNSAMDGYAVRFADLAPDGETMSHARRRDRSRASPGTVIDRRRRVRAHLHRRRDARGRRHRGDAGARAARTRAACTSPPGAVSKAGQNRRFAGEDLKAGQVVFRAGQRMRPAELGMIASLGIGEVSVYRRLRVAFFSTGDELKSIGTPLAAGEIYDSNRYTLYGMLTRLDCEVIDMGVVEDTPDTLERAFATPRQARRRRHHLGRRVGRRSRLRQGSCSTSWARCCSGRSR